MVTSNEHFTQGYTDGHFPNLSQRQQRRQAVMQAAENLALVLHAGDRISKALGGCPRNNH